MTHKSVRGSLLPRARQGSRRGKWPETRGTSKGGEISYQILGRGVENINTTKVRYVKETVLRKIALLTLGINEQGKSQREKSWLSER